MYLAVATIPNIAFLEESPWMMVKRVYKHIKGSTSMSIQYKADVNVGILEAYRDADLC